MVAHTQHTQTQTQTHTGTHTINTHRDTHRHTQTQTNTTPTSTRTLGYMAELMTSWSLMYFLASAGFFFTPSGLNFWCSSRRSASRSRGGMDFPGRPSISGLSLTMFLRSSSSNPPSGVPMYPWKYSTTLVGKLRVLAFSTTSSSLRWFCTINCARSPTTLELGVTCWGGGGGKKQHKSKGGRCW